MGPLKVAIVSQGQCAGEPACPPEMYLNAAFRSPPNASHAALQLGCHRTTVVRMRLLMAEYILEYQQFVLGSLIMLATMHPPGPVRDEGGLG